MQPWKKWAFINAIFLLIGWKMPGMHRAEKSMDPVLRSFRDNVLYFQTQSQCTGYWPSEIRVFNLERGN
jgi:hypothetical protein